MSNETKLTKVDIQFGGMATTVAVDDLGRWSLNDLHKAAGGIKAKEVNRWRKLSQTQEVIDILQADYQDLEVIASVRGGKNPGTFVAPELAIDYASWISPHFRVATSRVIVELTRRGYVAADRFYNVADVVHMYRKHNAIYTDHWEPLEGHNDVAYYADDEEMYRTARLIGEERLHKLSKREWAQPDKYAYNGEGNVEENRESWGYSRYYFVRVDEIYNFLEQMFGEELGNFAPEWRHHEEEMLSKLPRYRKEHAQSSVVSAYLARNENKPPLLTWDSFAAALYSDDDM